MYKESNSINTLTRFRKQWPDTLTPPETKLYHTFHNNINISLNFRGIKFLVARKKASEGNVCVCVFACGIRGWKSRSNKAWARTNEEDTELIIYVSRVSRRECFVGNVPSMQVFFVFTTTQQPKLVWHEFTEQKALRSFQRGAFNSFVCGLGLHLVSAEISDINLI